MIIFNYICVYAHGYTLVVDEGILGKKQICYLQGSRRFQWDCQPYMHVQKCKNDDVVGQRSHLNTWRHPRTKQEADEKKEADGNKGCDEPNMALLDLHEYLYKEILCTPWLTLMKGILKRKGSREICKLMRIFPTRKYTPHQENESHLYSTIKTPKPSQLKVCIIYPSSGTLELWKFSNLTFERYLAGITPILSVRYSLFLFCKVCLEYMRTVWLTDDFWYHQLVPSMGKGKQ